MENLFALGYSSGMVQLTSGDWWTTAQAAAHLKTTKRWVQSLIKRGKLPATKFGREWMIRKRDVLAWKPGEPGRPPKKPDDPKKRGR